MRLDSKDRFNEANHIRATLTPFAVSESHIDAFIQHIVEDHEVEGFGTSPENVQRVHIEVHLRDAERVARKEALQPIAELLDATHWDADTLSDIASIVRAAGLTIGEPA